MRFAGTADLSHLAGVEGAGKPEFSMSFRIFLLLLVMATPAYSAAEGGLTGVPGGVAVKTSSPKDTLQTFLTAMNRYADGRRTGNLDTQTVIASAIQCLNLQDVPRMNRSHDGRQTAIFLKEILDRLYVPDYGLIPGEAEVAGGKLTRWEVGDTGITIALVESGENKGEFLFTPSLVGRAEMLYEQVKDKEYLPGSGRGAAFEPSWILKKTPEWAKKRKFFDIALWQWIGLLAALFFGLIIRALTAAVLHILKLFAAKTKGEWDDRIVDALTGPLGLLLSCGFWLLSVNILEFSGVPLAIFQIVLQVLFFTAVIWLAWRFADLLGAYLGELASRTESTLDDQIVKLVSRTLKLFAVVTGMILAAQNLGFNVISLLAGLSIGGLAVALAMQSTLSNFIGSIMIMIDRSFQVGHWIKIGEAEGTVEEVDFRCTRIRTFYDSVISIPNAEVMNSKIDNLGKRKFRRVLSTIGVTPVTPPEKLDAFVEGIKQIILNNAFTRKDYFHVVFHQIGASSLDVMVYFYLKVPDFSKELVERHHIFVEILQLAQTMGVRLALPVQAVHVEGALQTGEEAAGRVAE